MESPRLISLAPFLLFLLLLLSTTTATTTVDFIRASCNDTSYPALCYTTLSPHAPTINNSNALLAQTAISISLKKSKAAAAYVTRLNTSTPVSEDLAPVLDDCVSTLMEAADLARDSIKQMSEIIIANKGDAIVDQSVRFKVSNVQTWMSAALSSQVTCIDGFEEVGQVADGLVKAEVVKRAGVAKRVTSNALALINKFVNA